jgi:nucleoside-diphosphate-sugar epimerase
MNLANIAVIGCGYIGSEAAHVWKNRGLHVTGTTRHSEHLEEIAKVAQKGVLMKGDAEAEFASLITANDVLLISIGADQPEDYDIAYRQTAHLFRHLALEMDIPRRLIYTGSTSVYGDHHGRFVDEESDLLAQTEQAKILAETERLYCSLTEFGWHICVLRLAEIYGPGRELSKRVKQYQDQMLPGSGDQFTNMIHKSDVSAAIDYALRHQLDGIFNLADDDHPTRNELYAAVAKQNHLKPPHCDPTLVTIRNGNKRVSNHKIKSEGFVFRFPHRLLD